MMISVEVDSEYLISCARIRNVTATTLLRKLMRAIEQDQLVLAILDDSEEYNKRDRYEHRFHSMNGRR